MHALLIQIGEVLTSWSGISIVSIVIILFATFHAIRFYRYIHRRIEYVESACKKIEQFEGEKGLAENFDYIDKEIREIPNMEHAWHEFTETLLFPSMEDSEEKIRNTKKPSAYFNNNSLLSGLNIRFYNVLPNILTGSGIMFTFIGLVAGIGLASQGLASDNIAQQRHALEQLLSGAALAFMTSIMGLVTSIIFSWIEKHNVHKFDKVCSQWNRGLDARLEQVTHEQLAKENLVHISQQSRVIETFTDQLAFQIAKAVDEKVTQPISPIMERMVEAVEGLRQDNNSSNEAVLQQVVEKFSETLTGAAGTELEKLGNTIGQLTEGLQQQIDTADKKNRETEESFAKATHDMQQVFNDGISQLQTTLDSFEHTLSSVKQMNSDCNSIVEKQQQMLDMMNESQKNLSETVKPIQNVATQFGDTSDILLEVGEKIVSASEANSQAVQEIKQFQEEITNIWQSYKERFDQVDQSLARTFQEIDEGLSRYNNSIQEFIQGIDTYTSNIVGQLSGAISELQESIEDFSEANNRGS